jgi:hypothetical protein
MDNTTRYSDTTHRRFIQHMDLARLWAQYNGQRGTAQQLSRIMRQLTVIDLERMLTERRVDIAASLGY